MEISRLDNHARIVGKITVLVLPILIFLYIQTAHSASAQSAGIATSVENAPLTTDRVVESLVAKNIERAEALLAYEATRTYRAEYKGLPSNRGAEMVVGVKYQAPGSKVFTIRSATGSKVIIDRVFKKLLEAEQEALGEEAQKRSALNSDNYDFTMTGYESTPSGSAYVFKVEPRAPGKLLYHGRIWVDAKDFAVVRLEGEPSKSPSFWTRNSEIEQVYKKVKDFWLPARNHSITLIRLGGRAELTIEYDDYQITAADRVGDVARPKLTQSAEARASPHQR